MSTWTIAQAISSYFPEGTQPKEETEGEGNGVPAGLLGGLKYYPFWPPDLFAAMAFLIEKSGAYSFWDPSNADLLKRSMEARDMGRIWRAMPIDPEADYKFDDWKKLVDPKKASPPKWPAERLLHGYLQSRWEKLIVTHSKELWSQPLKNGDLQPWCYVALELLIVADEASGGIGEAHYGGRDAMGNMVPMKRSDLAWGPASFDDEIALEKSRFLSQETRNMIWGSSTKPIIGLFETLTLMFDKGIACVLPKMRTPQVGATLRAFSHNVALVPGSQEVRNVWFQSPTAYSDARVFNVLVLPFPFEIPTSSFIPTQPEGITGGRWGGFKLSLDWLKDYSVKEFTDKLLLLIKDAERTVDGDVHGLVLPEAALSPAFFQAAVDEMCKDEGCNIELFIAGVAGPLEEFADIAKRSPKKDERDVNVVAIARFRTPEFKDVGGVPTRMLRGVDVFYQPKHHRWRLDRSQLKTYGLSAKLGGADFRWEEISTDFRNVHFLPLRTHGAIVGLVCEDLARIDPCQSVVRAIGPNLVVALLMDGPQLDKRWPARYATVLADDPGSSVLTVTSAGLVTRSYALGGKPESHIVALWRDGLGDLRPIPLQPGSSGFVLSLEARAVEERTLDDRSDDGTATRYELVQVTNVASAAFTYSPPAAPAVAPMS